MILLLFGDLGQCWRCSYSNICTPEKIVDKYKVFFGNYEDDADIGCYWFKMIVKEKYDFFDPLPIKDLRDKYYTHGWNGHSGYSVWVDQGKGKSIYDPEEIKNKLKQDFGVVLI